ncbi:hypothetical protein B0J11DRAFT_93138 [Dendryphion nanum]|uniref:Uncharacterized protein n=1 Tax=Dendryphion nanum TaxID=256645 RepID=A0A9P9DF61_9PLEO|nr:hypothetical protein B0J11DRAFT_93138 [Dendryphion nanum]
MPNVLVLSFEGFSFSARQLYQQLLPKLLSRASVHESLTIQDALNYINSGWPSIILVSDSTITARNNDSEQLLNAVLEYTRHGCTTITMGFFASTVEFEQLDEIFSQFDLKWQAAEYTKYDTFLANPDQSLIRTSTLAKKFYAKGVYLRKVPSAQMVYSASSGGSNYAYAALGRVGLGKLGYIGDVNYEEEPERLILAMCHLDRPEDDLEDA